ncbi:hypothetical protein QFZ55_007220 [Streptomyces luteogriseus]|uniref:hypothetical protein n=1 Tax=Streptomyces luteogriseus TaxID=68233 RepID=UPI002780F56F|nr:hypothetical protein [Streptomyces luteogriseus]MDQ0717768.1 hypothetical protein [Streptomyces luteogriseus]
MKSLDAWGDKHGGDAEQVCDAVMAAAGDPPGASADKGGAGGLGDSSTGCTCSRPSRPSP